MQANEAIEKLRDVAKAALAHHGIVLMTDPPLDAWKHHRVSERLHDALVATATIDPPGEAVGVEKEQQGNAIRPSAEPAGQRHADPEVERGLSDPLYTNAKMIVRANNRASISLVQRHLCIGYNRAARLLEAMEACKVVSHEGPAGARTVLAADLEEVPAAQPAAGHAKLAEGEREAFEAWQELPCRSGRSMEDAFKAGAAWQARGQQAGVTEGWRAELDRAAWMLDSYSKHLYELTPIDIEEHPYIPSIGECAEGLRAMLAAIPGEAK